MIFTLEALNAKHGDALLLHFGPEDAPRLAILDGGPRFVYGDYLEPRLTELRDARSDDGAPLPVRFAMVTHIDDDHIQGLLDLLNGMTKSRDDGEPPLCRIRTLWHNSFDDILGNDADELAAAVHGAVAAAENDQPLPPGLPLHRDSALVAASVKQGRKLRTAADGLNIDPNLEFDGKLIVAPAEGGLEVALEGGLTVKVVGPAHHRVLALQQKWAEHLQKLQQHAPNAEAEAAAFLDESVFNLSSIVLLAEGEGKRMLLTGDARGDDILVGLEAAGLLEEGKIHVDLFKVPHHGSDRNVTEPFFRQVTADHYVISADGKHGNPDVPMLKMLTTARGSDEYTIHLTNKPAAAADFLEADQANPGRRYTVVFRDADALSLRVDLGDAFTG